MTAVTISRQLGSLGCSVAAQAAEALGWRVAYRGLINEAALRAGVPEVALATIDELGLLGMRPDPDAVAAYHQAVRQVMHELAQAGSIIIVGRAGQAILCGRPDVLHVRLTAPAGLRAERLAQRKGISLEAAQVHIRTSDRHRAAYLRRYYHVDWDDPRLYDLVINTGRLAPAAAAAAIIELVRSALPLTTRSLLDDCVD